jgi:hypothetical protein
MNRSTIATRIRRLAMVGGAAAALTVLAPTAAHAVVTGWGGTLTPGQQHCLSRSATTQNYQVRGDGTATRRGARFSLLFNGSTLDITPVGTASGWAAERRSAYGNYPGAGLYTVCATNESATNTLVNIHLLVDSEFI